MCWNFLEKWECLVWVVVFLIIYYMGGVFKNLKDSIMWVFEGFDIKDICKENFDIFV